MPGHTLQGRAIALTGTLLHFKRREAKEKLEALGASVAGGVSKKVDIVVAGRDAGAKVEKAAAYGIRIVGEHWLRAVLSGADPDGPARFEAIDGDLGDWLQVAEFDGCHGPRDLRPLVEALHFLEAKEGVTELHREASRRALRGQPLGIAHSRNHNHSIVDAELSPCGRFLATVSNPPMQWMGSGTGLGSLGIWDLASGRVVNAIDLPGGGAVAKRGLVQWSGDGRRIFAPVWGSCIGRFDPFGSRGGPLMSASLGFGPEATPYALRPDGEQLWVSVDGRASGLPLAAVSTAEGLRFGEGSPGIRWLDGESLPSCEAPRWLGNAVAMSPGYAVHAETGEVLWDCRDRVRQSGFAARLSFSADAQHFVATGNKAFAGDAVTGAHRWDLPDAVKSVVSVHWAPLAGASNAGRFAAVGTDSVLLGNADGPIAVLDVVASDATFSPSGERLAILRADRSVQFFDATGAATGTLDAFGEGVEALCWGAGILVGWGPDVLEFRREDGRCVGRHNLLPEPGFVEPRRFLEKPFPTAEACPVPESSAGGWRWITPASNGRQLHCWSEDLPRLDELLVVTLGAELAWPWRWLGDGEVVSIIHDRGEATEKSFGKLLALASLGRVAKPDWDSDYGYETQTLQGPLSEEFGEQTLRVARVGAHCFRGWEPVSAEQWSDLVGQVVVFATRERQRERRVGTLLGSDGENLVMLFAHGFERIRLETVAWLAKAFCK